MNERLVFLIVLAMFVALAVKANREMPKQHVATTYSASDRAEMQKLVERVTLPEIRKMKPIALPSKKGIHWVSLAKVAAQTDDDAFTNYLTMAEKGLVK